MERARLPAVVDLIYDDYDLIYVRGHYYDPDDPEDGAPALEAARLYLEEQVGEWSDSPEDWEAPRLGLGRQLYGRLGFAPADSDHDRCFYTHDEPSRGAYAVTEVIDLDELDRRQAQRQAMAAHVAELEAFVLDWFPEATEIRGHGYPPDGGAVTFELPELLGPVFYNLTSPDHLYPQRRDESAFVELYQPRKRPPLESIPSYVQPTEPLARGRHHAALR